MRIAVFIKKTTFHKGYGGLETQNKALCEGLAERGHDITVFSPQHELDITKKTEHGVDYIFIPSTFRTLFSNFISDHWFNKSYSEFKNYHAKQRFELIVSQSSSGIGVIKHKNEFGIPVLSISHGSTLMEYKTLLQNISSIKDALRLLSNTAYTLYNLFFKQKFFIQNSDVVVTVSKYVAKTLSKETFSPKHKFVVIHNGVDPNKFKLAPKEEYIPMMVNPNFLYLGQVQKSKGMDYLIDIVEDPSFKDVHIDVVGDGDYMDHFKDEINKKGLNSFFTIHGKVEYSKVEQFYRRSYAFLFPTNRFEGFPMVLVEAMFNALPIVAFSKGGVSDAVDNNETGYLIKNRSIKKFKKALMSLVNNRQLRDHMSVKSLEKARKEFTIENMLNQYEQVFESLVK